MLKPVSRRTKLQRRRDKRKDTLEFSKRRITRRQKAKHDEVNRKKNRKCGYGG